MSEQLRHEIDVLKRQALALGGMAEEGVHRATVAMAQRDEALARAVIDEDVAIDMAEIELEEECLKVLALHQPVAVDLRTVVALLRINADLERIGDLAVNIAERAASLAVGEPVTFPFDFLGMARRVGVMLARSLDALMHLDVRAARSVVAEDDAVDAMNHAMHLRIQEAIRMRPSELDRLMLVLSASRQLERIADHCTNIARGVIYIVDGEVVRHRSGSLRNDHGAPFARNGG